MTMDVVDAFETVEIQKRHSKAYRLLRRREYRLVEPREKAAAIGQPCQSVEVGEPMVLVAEDLHVPLPIEKGSARPDEAAKSS